MTEFAIDDNDGLEGYDALMSSDGVRNVRIDVPDDDVSVSVEELRHTYTPPKPDIKGQGLGRYAVISSGESSLHFKVKACSQGVTHLTQAFMEDQFLQVVYETSNNEIVIDDDFIITDINHPANPDGMPHVAFDVVGNPDTDYGPGFELVVYPNQ